MKKILSYGPKFAVEYESKETPILKLIADCETIISDFQNDDVRHDERSIHPTTYCERDVLIIRYVEETKDFIASIKNIVIAQADKRNKTIIIRT